MVYYPPEKRFDIEKIVNQDVDSPQLQSVQNKKRKKMLFKRAAVFLGIFFLVAIFSGGYLVYKTNSTFNKITGEKNSIIKSFIKMLPLGNNIFQVLPTEEEESAVDKFKNNEIDRINILLLGIRGVDDPNGGLLTDTIMVASINPELGKVALISIPRDLFVDVPYHDKKSKINEVYVQGIMDKNSWKAGLNYSEKAVEDVTGLDIHYSASVDFKAFKEIIDILGGVTITLNEPFAEKNQFEEGPIELPAGKQLIDGDTALLFVRARFSSDDFKRAERQQQILVAIKEKAFGLGILSNPLKIISILNSAGNHIKTDAELWEIQEMVAMTKGIENASIKRKVLNTDNGGLLFSSRDSNGAYILLPEGGNFDKIHEACINVFE